MKVGRMCSRKVVTARPDESLLAVARRMREEHVGSIVVVDQQEDRQIPVGIITDRDIVVALVGRGIDQVASFDARDLVSREIVTTHDGEDVAVALERMLQHGVRRLPVVQLAWRPGGHHLHRRRHRRVRRGADGRVPDHRGRATRRTKASHLTARRGPS